MIELLELSVYCGCLCSKLWVGKGELQGVCKVWLSCVDDAPSVGVVLSRVRSGGAEGSVFFWRDKGSEEGVKCLLEGI